VIEKEDVVGKGDAMKKKRCGGDTKRDVNRDGVRERY
jgi:hypothetical protein